jgi:hypothetical protein
VARTTIIVEPSTVLQWSQPVSAVRGPSPTPQSAAATSTTTPAATHTTSSTTLDAVTHSNTSGFLPMTQGLGVPPTVPLPLSLDFPTGPRDFDPSDPSEFFSIPPDSFFASSAAGGLYKNDAQGLPFSPFITLGATTSMSIPPSNRGIFDPSHPGSDFTAATAAARSFNSRLPSTSQKRGLPPVPVQDGPSKRRKLEARNKYPVDQQVGALQVDHRSAAITHSAQTTEVNASNRSLSTRLPGANQGPTNAIIPPIPVLSFDRPHGMSRGEFIKLLQAKITAESDASALDG